MIIGLVMNKKLFLALSLLFPFYALSNAAGVVVLNNTANKWEDVGKNAIKDKRVFQTGWLEKLRQFDYKMLGEIEDNPFVKKNFTNRLGSYMHVNNITDINQVPEEAQIIAYQEALKATFKDDNFITNLFRGVKKSTGKFGELVLPFTKTPSNLTARSIEYSPLGIAKAIYDARTGKEAYQIIKKQMEQND